MSSCTLKTQISILYFPVLRLCLEEVVSPVSLSSVQSNNPAEISISWVILSSHGRLNLGDGFGGKGGTYSLLCWNQNFCVGNPMLMKTLSLAGGWCWYPFSAVPRISHTFTLFVLLSLRFLLWLCRKTTSNSAVYTLHPAWHFFPPSFFCSFSDILSTALSVSTSNAWSGTNVQRLSTVCFQPLCHHLIPLLSVYSGICVRKYILRWLIPTRLISAAGWWLPAALCGIFVWRAIFENKFCRWYKSDH